MPASASIGTGVGATPLSLTRPAHAGSTHKLSPLYVKNTGTVTAVYKIHANRLQAGTEHAVPSTWIHLHPGSVRLAPGKIRAVSVVLTVPLSARSGKYMTDLVATTYAAHHPGAPTLGAAAADKLTFTIPPSSTLPVLAIAIAALMLLVLAIALRKEGRRRTKLATADHIET